jgi:type I restriction enzyme S subunit
LPQALLAKAFRGELVEQLPTDGDARDLLEQIKRAKEGLEKGGKGRKLKVEDEVRMVADEGARYGKK